MADQPAQTESKALVLPDLTRMTPARAELLCREKPDIAAQLIIALMTQNTAMLPGTAFVRRADGELLMKQRVALVLHESSGDLDKLPNNKWMMSLQGVRRCNEVASLQIIRPETVIVEGVKQMNPYIHVDPETKMVDVCYARCIAVGYSPNGSLVATDATIRLDANLYFLENVQAKMKKLQAKADQLGRYGSVAARPVDGDNPVGPAWIFMPIHTIGLGLWLNTAHPMMTDVFENHTTRCKYLERLAQSFAERNALKSHPAIPSRIDAQNGVATVNIYGWTTDFSRAEIDKLRQMIEADCLHEFQDREGRQVAVESVIEQDEEEAKAVIDAELEQERRAEGGGEDDEQEAQEGSEAAEEGEDPRDLLQSAVARFTELSIAVGVQRAKKVAAEFGMEHVEEGTPEQHRQFIEKVTAIMEQDL